MSVIEQGGKVATGAIDALAGSPALLVMVILNIGMIGAAAWYLNQRDVANAQIVNSIIERCFPADPRHGSPVP